MGNSSVFISIRKFLPENFFPLMPWAVKNGVGSFITFEYGERRIVKKNNENFERGSIHLWVYLCDWEIFNLNESILNSNDLCESNADLINIFLGRNLLDILVDDVSHMVKFVFEKELFLKLFFSDEYDKDDEMFILYVGQDVYSYSFNDGLVHE